VGTCSTYLGASVSVGNATDRLVTAHSTAEYFQVLRPQPLIGRLWTAADESHGNLDVAVIGYEFWQRRFAKATDVLGRTVSIDDRSRSYRIIGVLPAGAGAPDEAKPIAVWVPSVPDRTSAPGQRSRFLFTLGRVRPGVTTAALTTEIQSAVAPLVAANPAEYKDWRPETTPLLDLYVGDTRGWLLLLLGVVSLVVLIACVNAANVMLTRSAARAHDFAIRASLGASRRQLAMSLLTESVMLSMGACACALLFSSWAIGVVKATLPLQLFRAGSIAVNGRVFAAAILAAVATGILFGTVPAWQASRTSVVTLLKDAGTVTSARRRWRSAFLVVEIACIGVLLVASTLFITSFIRVMTLDLGFERSNLLAVSTVTHYAGTANDVRDRLARVPGVTGVAAVAAMPPLVGSAYGGAYPDSPLQAAGAGAGATSIDVDTYRVTPNYFDVVGIAFRRGATWSAAGSASHPMVVDEVAARALFGSGDPIGRQVQAHDLKDTVFTIVGIVPFAFARGPEDSLHSSAYYAMLPDDRPSWVGFVLRTSVPPAWLVRTVESSLAEIAPPDPSSGAGVHVVDDAFGRLTATRRFNAALMSAFALFALILGAAGIYAVMASIVSQQTREIGVRVALGATGGNIRRGVLAMAGRHLLVGLALGLTAAWWVSRGFASLFFQVRPTDLSIYLIVAATLAVVGFLGAIVPARRAASVDPIVSLRSS
jgi:putative ABC transport system permease protein